MTGFLSSKKLLITLWLFSWVFVPLFFASSSEANTSPKARLHEAEKYAKNGQIDYAFMEYKALLREHPGDPLAWHARFAIGEYHYTEHNDLRSAAETFGGFKASSSREMLDVIGIAYLLKCAERLKDTKAVAELERHLKETLSGNQSFFAFEEKKTIRWKSPLGFRFELKEFVDRLEIYRDEKLFYTIQLP